MEGEQGDTVFLVWRSARRRRRGTSAGQGGRGWPAGPGGLKGRVGQLVAGPIGPEAEIKSFQSKN
jgi:hypothetical protein